MNTRFLNVDLELVATTDLQPLLAHLEASTISSETLARIAGLAARLEITVFSPEPEDRRE